MASIQDYLIMQLCVINFSRGRVIDLTHECMVKCGHIKCMAIHSQFKECDTTANGLTDFSSGLEGPITVTLV